jgi:hypothetical protein
MEAACMEEVFNTLRLLEKLNKNRKDIIYTEKEIDEEKENINGLEEIHIRLKNVLNKFDNMPDQNEDSIIEQLIQLHLIYSDLVWQYDQMHEMIKKMIKLYR